MRSRLHGVQAAAVAALMALSTPSASTAGAEVKFSAHTFDGQVRMAYRFFSPVIKPGARYPLVVTLHGVGQRGTDNVAQLDHALGVALAEDSTQAKYPCFVVAPQCPVDYYWAGQRPLWSGGSSTYDQSSTPETPAMTSVRQLIDHLTSAYPIDAARLYVVGISMGAIGAWDLVTRKQGIFAAVVPLSGLGDTTRASSVSGMGVWVVHGDQDRTVSVSGARAMVRALERSTGTAVYRSPCTSATLSCTFRQRATLDSTARLRTMIYTEAAGAAHEDALWRAANYDPSIHRWMFAQRRPASAVYRVEVHVAPRLATERCRVVALSGRTVPCDKRPYILPRAFFR